MRIFLVLLGSMWSVFAYTQYTPKDDYTVRLAQDTVVCNTYSSKTIHIIPDSTPIYKGARVKVVFPKYFTEFAWNDMIWIITPPMQRAGYLQARNSRTGLNSFISGVTVSRDEFVNIPSSRFDYRFSHEDNARVVTIVMQDTVRVGDTLQVIYGANGAATNTYNSQVAHSDVFTVLLDNTNSGNYVALESQPTFVFKAAAPRQLNLALASSGKPGKPVLLKVMVNDAYKNQASGFDGYVQLSCSDPGASFPSVIRILPEDNGWKDVYVTFSQHGVYTVSASVLSANYTINGTYSSNPVSISDDSLRIFWGDFHTHTKFSRDGFGSEGYRYAKNAIGLDFYGGTDHADMNNIDTFGINRNEWNTLQQEVLQTDEADRFVAFLGYENSLDNPSGHYNFIYNFDNSEVDKVPNIPRHFYFTIQNLWAKMDQLNMQGKVLTIPHHTGKLFGSVGPDNGATQFGGTFYRPEYKRIIEIYSGHGQGEYYNPSHNLAYEKFGGRSTKFPSFAQDAWAAGEKLGAIASTDSHNGQPAQTNIGLAAVMTDSLTRGSIFNGLYSRHTYATTGEKIILKFNIGDAMMGDELTVPKDSLPLIKAEVYGTDALESVELMKWNFKKGTYSGTPQHPVFEVVRKVTFSGAVYQYTMAILDTALRDSSMYYLRVKQKKLVSNREVWAWSSPIWVHKPSSDTRYSGDSLYNFELNYQHPTIQVKWCLKDKLATDYFEVERSSGDTTRFISLGSQRAPLPAGQDSCYWFFDNKPDDSVLYYRIKSVSYLGAVQYSPWDSVHIPFVKDSVYGLKASVLSDRIGVSWSATEFFAYDYEVQKGKQTQQLQTYQSQSSSSLSSVQDYSLSDFYPLKDTSYYRVVMNLPDGWYKLSNIDTLYFPIDQLMAFDINLSTDTVYTYWKGLHEQQVERYELQRSQDMSVFYTVYTAQPAGHLFDTTSYQFEDTAAMAGWNYYRVLQYMADGSVIASPVDSVRIFLTNDGVPQVYQPAAYPTLKLVENLIDEGKSYLEYSVESPQQLKGTFLIVSMDGKSHYREDASLQQGFSRGAIPIGGLYSGTYYLFFIANDQILKQAFVIVHHGGCTH